MIEPSKDIYGRKKLRILVLTTSFPITRSSSSGIFVKHLAEQLGNHCHVSVLAPAGHSEDASSERSTYNLFTFKYAPQAFQVLAHGGGGIPTVLREKRWSKLLLPFFLISMFVNCVWHTRKTDIILANWSICGVIAGVAGVLLRKPVFTTIRGEDASRAHISKIDQCLIWLCLSLNKKLITVSDGIAEGLWKLFPNWKHKIVMIPNGVHCSPQVASRGCDDENISIIMVGSLIERKDVSTALKALSFLPTQFSLIILGSGSERDNLVKLAHELEIDKRVTFVGHVEPNKVVSYLSKSDLLLIASKSEGRPNVVLEAFAAGKPVVGSDIPGTRELIIPGENGSLFTVGNSQELAEVLRPFACCKYRTYLGKGGVRFIVENGLSWENTTNKYLELFTQQGYLGN